MYSFQCPKWGPLIDARGGDKIVMTRRVCKRLHARLSWIFGRKGSNDPAYLIPARGTAYSAFSFEQHAAAVHKLSKRNNCSRRTSMQPPAGNLCLHRIEGFIRPPTQRRRIQALRSPHGSFHAQEARVPPRHSGSHPTNRPRRNATQNRKRQTRYKKATTQHMNIRNHKPSDPESSSG